ncbi:MAG: PKD domain-containing protein, partial [Crocinitomicaceae bacterium]|nr:PKD domain-containing protein [Crocinitomicaceae bacterium]
NACPNGVDLSTVVVVQPCEAVCPEAITGAQYGEYCLNWYFSTGSAATGENVVWYFGDGTEQAGGHIVQHSYLQPGTYTVTAHFTSNACPDGENLSLTITVLACAPESDCPEAISSHLSNEGCQVWAFEIGSASPGESVIWNFGDGSVVPDDHVIYHHYLQGGVYTVTAFYSSDVCPDGVYLTKVITVIPCQTVCPQVITAGQYGNSCFSWYFSTGAEAAGENIVWHFGDGTEQEGGHFIQHTYTHPGTYNVYAQFTSNSCPNGINLTIAITVQQCNVPVCPQTMSAQQYGEVCLNWAFEIGSATLGESVVWSFGDGVIITDDHAIQHTYLQAGTYTVTANYSSNACPNGVTITQVITVQPCSPPACPQMMIASQYGTNSGCLHWAFVIGDAMPGVNIVWNFGDGTDQVTSTHYVHHVFQHSGTYSVTAFYTSNACPNGVSLTQIIAVQSCFPDCPQSISSHQVGNQCQVWAFEVGPAAEGDIVIWNFGDGLSQTDDHAVQHTYTQPGTYTVTAHYTSSACENGVDLTTSIEVISCNSPVCPQHIYGYPSDFNCMVWSFSTGPALTDNSVEWYFGDGTEQEGGNTIQHTFLEPGTYTITAHYTSSSCPNGVILTETIVVEPCSIPVCPQSIAGHQYGEICLNWAFEIGSATPGENVVWSFGDGMSATDDHVVQHTYSQGGTYTVVAFYTSSNCPDGVYLTQVITVVPCQPLCPQTIFAQQHGEVCLNWVFEIGSATPGESVVWNFSDGNNVTDDHAVQHTFSQPGIYVVNAFYTSNACPNGVYLTHTISVQDCNTNLCPEAITGHATENSCLNWVFEIGSASPGESVDWNFGDGAVTSGGHFAEHHYASPGVYVVTANYTSNVCQSGVTLVFTVIVQQCSNTVCPQTILGHQQGDLCYHWVFEIGSSAPGENVVWHFGDGDAETGGHTIQHTYLHPGVYIVTAHYASNVCPNGVDLTYTIIVQECSTTVCPETLFGHQQGENCMQWTFEIGNFIEGEQVVWSFGDGTQVSGDHFAQHEFSHPGTYTVCGFYTSPHCPEGVNICKTVQVTGDCGVANCSLEISASNLGNGLWQFTASGSPVVTPMLWTFGNGISISGGWEIQHQFEPGDYYVCGSVSSNLCPQFSDCVSIHVPQPQECNELNFGFDSFVENGGPHFLHWVLTNSDQQVVGSGIAQYSAQDPWYDFNTCLPSGCYYLHACGDLDVTNSNFSLFVSEPAEMVSFTPVSNEECHGFNAEISVNGGCEALADCHAAFNPIYTETAGHIEFLNQSLYEGDATFIWSYGDGQHSDDYSGNVQYNSNGTYHVCLTIINGDCTDIYCEEVVVEGMEEGCQSNLVTVSLSGNYPSPNAIDLLEIILAANGIEFNTQQLPLSGEINFNGTFCVPDGCYSIEVNSLAPLVAMNVQMTITVNGEVLDVLTLLQGQQNGEISFGLNSDCETTVSENEVRGNVWLVYPNPANQTLTISGADRSEVVLFILTDASGRIIRQFRSLGRSSLTDVSELANGLYLLRIMTEDSSVIRPLLIQH